MAGSAVVVLDVKGRAWSRARSQSSALKAESRTIDRSRHPPGTAVTIIGDTVPCVYREGRRLAAEFSTATNRGGMVRDTVWRQATDIFVRRRDPGRRRTR